MTEEPYIRVYLQEDSAGTYFVEATILEDGKPSSAPYPIGYKKLVNNWDNLFPHLSYKKLKSKVTREARIKGYGVEITKQTFK